MSVGHNQPPGQMVIAGDVHNELAAFLNDAPVVDETTAKKAAELIKRGRLCLQDLNDERTLRVKPLNDEVKSINAAYRTVVDPLDALVEQIKHRLTAYTKAEEARRAAEAEAARVVAAEAERAAQAALEAQQQAIENAGAGEFNTEVARALGDAWKARDDAARAARAAVLAEKDVTVRTSTGFGRSMGLRDVEVLTVENPVQAVLIMWPMDKLRDALLSCARDYRKTHGELPKGIGVTVDRRI
jgi:hypothetical protein